MLSSILPSDHWPSFLRLALETGSPEERPISRALNLVMSEFSLQAGLSVMPLHPRLVSPPHMRNVLSQLGFACDTLSDAEVIELMNLKDDFLRGWGQAAALLKLARFYMGPCHIRRGHDFSPDLIEPHRRLYKIRLGQSGDRDENLCFVLDTAEDRVSADRIEDFRSTCRSLVPQGFQVLVKRAIPLTLISTTRNPKRLTGFRLNQRRMA